jgi:hypothetical protein
MDCCVLSTEEVGRLKVYNILPNHDDHTHLDTKLAIDGLKTEEYELVTSKDGRNYVTKSKMYFLQKRHSGGIPVIQRVRAAQPKYLLIPRS